MIHKALRLFRKLNLYASSAFRRVYLRLMYPGLTIDSKTIIERNCRIICVDGGKLLVEGSYICEGTFIFSDEKASVVINHAHIGRHAVIVAKKQITIGHQCAIAEMVVIRDQDHAKANPGDDTLSGYTVAPVSIGKHVWIGSKATILKGVSIGDHAIIAASAVVSKSVPSREVWGGVPARYIKQV